MKRITRKDSALGEQILSEEDIRQIEADLKEKKKLDRQKERELKKQRELEENKETGHSSRESERNIEQETEVGNNILSSTRDENNINISLDESVIENSGNPILIHSLTELNSELNDSFKSFDIETLRQSAFFSKEIKIEPIEENQEEIEGSNQDNPEPEITIMTEFPFTNFHKSIPEFSGTNSELNRFIACCDLFNGELTTDPHRETFLKFLVKKFSGRAFDFYSKQTWANWLELKNALKKYFSSSQSFEGFQMQLSKQKQGILDVKKFAEKIQEILLEMNRISSEITVANQTGTQFFKAQNEKLAIKSFVNGLNEPIRGYLKSQTFTDLQAAIKSAIELESDEYLNKNFGNLLNSEPQSKPLICFKCNKTGHAASVCRGRFNSFNRNRFQNFSSNNNFGNFRNRQNNNVTCFRCHKSGHTVPNCRVNINRNGNSNLYTNRSYPNNGLNRNVNGNGANNNSQRENTSNFSRNNTRGHENNNRNSNTFIPNRNRQNTIFNRNANANIAETKNEIEQTAELDNVCLDLIAM